MDAVGRPPLGSQCGERFGESSLAAVRHDHHLDLGQGRQGEQLMSLAFSPSVEKIDPDRVGRRLAAPCGTLPQNGPHPPQQAKRAAAHGNRQAAPAAGDERHRCGSAAKHA